MAVLDSSFLIDLLRNRPAALELRDHLDREAALWITSPSIMELWEGVLQSSFSAQEKSRVEELFASLGELTFDGVAARRAAEIGHDLARRGEAIETEDIMIAGIALANGQTVVTRDAHFTRIPGLKVLKY
ncbi:PIN domain-containing protein [Candidatus Woesearchaeota archaeon]|nr:PIN domain-containing protein [Candidatus Woesearchaeota archaeon]